MNWGFLFSRYDDEEHEKTHRAIVMSFFSMLFFLKTVRSTLTKRQCRRRGLNPNILNLRGFYIRYIIEGFLPK